MVDLKLTRVKEFDEIVSIIRAIDPNADLTQSGDEIIIHTSLPLSASNQVALKLSIKNSSKIRGEFE